MARRLPKLEYLFAGGVLPFMLAGLFLEFCGIAPRVGFWIAIYAFGIGWIPAMLAVVFIVIPEWWRRGKAG